MELGTKITYRAKRAAPEIPKRRWLRLPTSQGDMERAHSDPGEVSGGMGFCPGAVGLLLEGSEVGWCPLLSLCHPMPPSQGVFMGQGEPS